MQQTAKGGHYRKQAQKTSAHRQRTKRINRVSEDIDKKES